jgi:hypothetical protein
VINLEKCFTIAKPAQSRRSATVKCFTIAKPGRERRPIAYLERSLFMRTPLPDGASRAAAEHREDRADRAHRA